MGETVDHFGDGQQPLVHPSCLAHVWLQVAAVHAAATPRDLYWYAQRRCTFTLERNTDFGRRAMLLNGENSGIPAAT